MKVMVISRSWPSNERSGVSLAAATHVKMLAELGHEVSIIGANPEVLNESLPVEYQYWVSAKGSGALYSRAKVDQEGLKNAILKSAAQVVLIEAWQTALTDAAIETAFQLKIPVLMISHGIALQPHDNTLTQWFRSVCWIPYRYFTLTKLIKKLNAITALDEASDSPRFIDRELAKEAGIKVFPLKNSPVHWVEYPVSREDRKLQVLVVGYFTPVKNQLDAIQALSHLPEQVTLRFIGSRSGAYFESCKKLVGQLDLENRVSFLQDDECNIAQEIANSMVVYSPSLTEALPMVLIEAMACGTPFVATPVGSVPGLKGGMTASGDGQQVHTLREFLENNEIWKVYSEKGRAQYQAEFSKEHIREQLASAVNYCVKTTP
ncbi:hypothetical protein AOC10_01660 [Polynucleobacter asymbioticus]|uniref:glycosyltransferase family 4 protein n=1 Tax=Polynucleobacter asymbioticus TaxID=576611 RepID=UPI0008FB6CC1|nr:glycosyltransferase family 4 protein [Polynucleobacter asymbioticus]APC05324.1 hypothetical protein AOC10_01660 [Polynucleobacter asymbioticus]